MKAITVDDNALRWRDAADPVAGAGEILIRNRATAINRADLAQRPARIRRRGRARSSAWVRKSLR
jgi:NADPH:quinone reductase-like Zn-dependent oxidoreductase